MHGLVVCQCAAQIRCTVQHVMLANNRAPTDSGSIDCFVSEISLVQYSGLRSEETHDQHYMATISSPLSGLIENLLFTS